MIIQYYYNNLEKKKKYDHLDIRVLCQSIDMLYIIVIIKIMTFCIKFTSALLHFDWIVRPRYLLSSLHFIANIFDIYNIYNVIHHMSYRRKN